MQRFTISLDDALASAFDDFIARRGYANRSEAVRDLLRAELQRADLAEQPQHQGVACLSYVYNHHQRELAERMTVLQHAHHDLTVATMHAHLDHEHCLEAVLLRGPTPAVQRFADAVCAERGVHHGHLNLIAVDVHHPQPHRHDAAHADAAAAPARADARVHADGAGHAHDDAQPKLQPHVHLRPRR